MQAGINCIFYIWLEYKKMKELLSPEISPEIEDKVLDHAMSGVCYWILYYWIALIYKMDSFTQTAQGTLVFFPLTSSFINIVVSCSVMRNHFLIYCSSLLNIWCVTVYDRYSYPEKVFWWSCDKYM